MEKEQLVILGNGFDLALGMKTSYNDFFKWLFTNKKIVTFDKDYSLHESEYPEIIKTNGKNQLVNFWCIYFSMTQKSNGLDWNNVESHIEDVVKTLENCMDYSIIDFLTKNDVVNKSKQTYRQSEFILKLFLRNFIVTKNESIMSILLLQLKQFECFFVEYLNTVFSGNIETHIKYNYTELLKSMGVKPRDGHYDANSTAILNFNYSSLPDFVDSTRNIHGTIANNNIIFGIDSSTIEATSPIYIFTKESRIMHASVVNQGNSQKDILNRYIKTIKFFGHSLAQADYAYFQSIFDYLSIYDNDVTLIFYYGFYFETNKIKLLEYENEIQNLLSVYGKTLDNKDHGKNLMTKMMLENRLQIKLAIGRY
ncbi:AbiH family protein [Liquorilactobacillus mali]|uniref:AbiH family protein n=1 Tax=Liquorilactobacillus mali TaxID=1618 RepID=UPI00234FEEDB|nr:AbiH family protein [Liquorilactobacillus mali]MDC7952291.1 hypothetical protein [Liquorilactobacillus mali]